MNKTFTYFSPIAVFHFCWLHVILHFSFFILSLCIFLVPPFVCWRDDCEDLSMVMPFQFVLWSKLDWNLYASNDRARKWNVTNPSFGNFEIKNQRSPAALKSRPCQIRSESICEISLAHADRDDKIFNKGKMREELRICFS